MTRPVHLLLGGIALGLASLGAQAADALPQAQWPFTAEPRATLDEPWAMTFLPDGTLLVTEKRGVLKHVDPKSGKSSDIAGVPEVAYGGQGGFGDVILHPDFANNHYVYISYAEAGDGDTRGAAVARAKLQLNDCLLYTSPSPRD